MLRRDGIYFITNYLVNYPDLFTLFQTDKAGNFIETDLHYLQVDHINSNQTISFKDAAGQIFNTAARLDEWTNIGDRCLVPFSFKRYGDNIYPMTAVGYLKVEPGPLTYVNNTKLHRQYGSIAEIGLRTVGLTERMMFSIVDNDAELPDEFFKYYHIERKEKLVDEMNIEALDMYLAELALLNYDAKYNVPDDLSQTEEAKKYKDKYKMRYQTFESRQSKVYILDAITHKVLKKTNAMIANHKATQFGMDAVEFRKLENQKILDLCEAEGYNRDNIIFARKEIGHIRALIDKENSKEVRARFVEIDFNTHEDVNNRRYLQDGNIIDIKDGHWWFVKD
ncbi:MAG: hypothetical protein IJF92_00320 [Bacilli bacterium]|nr:hypothetical protein [Bacilli bacterium]MBQ3307568.1 hypothetical protein [Bacilli bacterium]